MLQLSVCGAKWVGRYGSYRPTHPDWHTVSPEFGMVKSKASPLNSFLEVLAYSWPNWQPITPSGPLRLRYDRPGTVCVEINLNQQTTGHTSWIVISIVYFKTACLIICHFWLRQSPKPLVAPKPRTPRCLKVHQSLPQLLWIKARPWEAVFFGSNQIGLGPLGELRVWMFPKIVVSPNHPF